MIQGFVKELKDVIYDHGVTWSLSDLEVEFNRVLGHLQSSFRGKITTMATEQINCSNSHENIYGQISITFLYSSKIFSNAPQ